MVPFIVGKEERGRYPFTVGKEERGGYPGRRRGVGTLHCCLSGASHNNSNV